MEPLIDLEGGSLSVSADGLVEGGGRGRPRFRKSKCAKGYHHSKSGKHKGHCIKSQKRKYSPLHYNHSRIPSTRGSRTRHHRSSRSGSTYSSSSAATRSSTYKTASHKKGKTSVKDGEVVKTVGEVGGHKVYKQEGTGKLFYNKGDRKIFKGSWSKALQAAWKA